ncbi:MAG: type II secretion system protein [Candidatus Falkowbacteria bacterium]
MKNKKGFTLIEITVVMGIFLIFMVMVGDFIVNGFRAVRFGYDQEDAVANARKVMDVMIEEIREASQSSSGDYLIDDVEGQNFSFYSNIDSDAEIEKVRYFLDAGVFKKGIIEPSGDPLVYLDANEVVSEIAQHVNNQAEDIFYYYDTDYNLIADPVADKNNIRLIHISLKINVTPGVSPNDFYVSTDIQIRNLKDNL